MTGAAMNVTPITRIKKDVKASRNPIKGRHNMLPEQQQKAFGDFYDVTRNNGILEPKTTLLLHLAAAMAVGCVPCMEHYLPQAGKEGITAEEIGAVQSIVMAVAAGRVNAQLRQVEKKLDKEQSKGCSA